MRRFHLHLALAILVMVAGVSAAWALTRDEPRFPHAKHVGLFPTCMGCHAGIDSATEAQAYPDSASCTGCHNGREQRSVGWGRPSPTPDNVDFSHPEHAREALARGDTITCQRCHAIPGATRFMEVARAEPESCIGCHAHRASAHLAADSRCATCHVPLAQARELSDSAVAALPRPPSHDDPRFLLAHGADATADPLRCAVCHARESCERCHANAPAIQSISGLGTDERVARLVRGLAAEYPTPLDHQRWDFRFAHGGAARSATVRCANCHTQPSCRSCHIGRGAQNVIAQLPREGAGRATGVHLRRASDLLRETGAGPSTGGEGVTAARSPAVTEYAAGSARADDTLRALQVRVHLPGFTSAHGGAAASKQLACSGCHERRFCSDCHDGEGRRRFHVPNFVSRHAAESYGRPAECSTCHNPEGFCKECHQGAGLRSQGRLTTTYHNAQPVWLLQHGQAARQQLESCTACHTQRDCMQCHSTIGRRVNPHGPGFDARRMHARNPIMCRYCHVADPFGAR
jgi:hypothetical protein